MDLYTLDDKFRKTDVVDDFNSLIWTERYVEAGDVNLVVPLSRSNVKKIPEGTFLALTGTKEVMQVESALKDTDKGTLKCTGPSLAGFLKNRVIFDDPSNSNWEVDQSEQYTHGAMMATIVQSMIQNKDSEAIPNLTVGEVDNTGSVQPLTLQYGEAYEAIAQIAKGSMVGFSLYLESADDSGDYALKFETYSGRNLTSNQTDHPTVQFSSIMDTLAHSTELHSIANYKNVAIAYASGWANVVTVSASGVNPEAVRGFDRRVMLVQADNVPDPSSGGESDVQRILFKAAADALANNNYVKMVDGTIVPQGPFKFGRDYGLGDMIELVAYDGDSSTARITEYIRTQDQTGEQEYPTISLEDIPPPDLPPS